MTAPKPSPPTRVLDALRAGAPAALYAAVRDSLQGDADQLLPAAIEAFEQDGGPARGGRRAQAVLTAVAAQEMLPQLDRESATAAQLGALVFLQQVWTTSPLSGAPDSAEQAWSAFEGWGERALVAAARARLGGRPDGGAEVRAGAAAGRGSNPAGASVVPPWTGILAREVPRGEEPLGGLLRAAALLAIARPRWRELRALQLARAALDSPPDAAAPVAAFLSSTWRRSGLAGAWEPRLATAPRPDLVARAARLDARPSFGLVLQLAELAATLDARLGTERGRWGASLLQTTASRWSNSLRHWTAYSQPPAG